MIRNPITRAVSGLQNIRQEAERAAVRIVTENLDVITQLIDAQMEAGIKGTGEPITPFYTPFTVLIKQQKGQPFDRVTLRDTGSFRNLLATVIQERVIQTLSTDPKTQDLAEKYGLEIFDMTTQNTQGFIDTILLPKMIEWAQNFTRNLAA